MKNANDLSCLSCRWQVATFVLQVGILVVVLLHLFAAWEYKAKWQDLNSRMSQIEGKFSTAPSEIAKPK